MACVLNSFLHVHAVDVCMQIRRVLGDQQTMLCSLSHQHRHGHQHASSTSGGFSQGDDRGQSTIVGDNVSGASKVSKSDAPVGQLRLQEQPTQNVKKSRTKSGE